MLGITTQCFWLAQLATFDGDKAWAKALQAGEVFIAGRLINFTFVTKLSLDRCDRHAVGFTAAVTTTFTH
ncbi:hypothetical protein D3C75_693210 [compost metagenome]